MKKLLITYDTVDVDGVQGETCCELEVSDFWAKALLDEDSKKRLLEVQLDARATAIGNSDALAKYMLNSLLSSIERLKSRVYVQDSIKDIRQII